MKTLESLTKEDKVACIKNWVDELNQESNGAELLSEYRKSHIALRKSIDEYRDAYSLAQISIKELTELFNNSQIKNNTLINENEKLKNSKSLSEENLNNLVNDRIASIFRNPLTYLMSLPVTERNELIGRIYTAIIGIKFS